MGRKFVRFVWLAAGAALFYVAGFLCYGFGQSVGAQRILFVEARKCASPVYECFMGRGAENAIEKGLLKGKAAGAALDSERRYGKVVSWEVIHVKDFGNDEPNRGIYLRVVREKGLRYEFISNWTVNRSAEFFYSQDSP